IPAAKKKASDVRVVGSKKKEAVIKKTQPLVYNKKENIKKYNTQGSKKNKDIKIMKPMTRKQVPLKRKQSKTPIKQFPKTVKKVKNTPSKSYIKVGNRNSVKKKNKLPQLKANTASKKIKKIRQKDPNKKK
ncbi:unnamed protein product, partial [Meganyctiphanes norvegica]